MEGVRARGSTRLTVLAVLVAIGILLVSPPVFASLITQFDFVSEPASTQAGAYIEFKGGPTRTVTFPEAPSGYDFVITQSDAADLIGINGNINGTFTVGAITTAVALQTASLTGTGTFSLTDPDGKVLSATLVWNDIYTYGATGGLNPENAPNLTQWTYSGSYQSFLDIKNAQDQSSNLTFQFNPAKKLGQLMATGADTLTTYSGSFSMTPEPATLGLLGAGLAALLRRRRGR
jgi:hypothetical protein